MSPVSLASQGPDCVLVKQPDVVIKETAVAIPETTDLSKTTTSSQVTEESFSSTETSTATSTTTTYGGWKYNGVRKSRTFDCEYPTTNANVHRVLEPLPFPKKLAEVIAWTDAFVDRIAIMTAEQEKSTKTEITKYVKEIERYRKLVEVKVVEIHKHEETQRGTKRRIEELERELEASRAINKSLKKTIETQTAKHKKEIQKWIAENDKDDREIAEGKAHLARDHAKLEHEMHLRVEAEAHLRDAQSEIAAKDSKISSLETEIAGLRTTITEHITTIRNLEVQLHITMESHRATTHKYEETLEIIKRLETELAEAKIKAAESDKAHKEAVSKYTEKITIIERTIREITILKESLITERDALKKQIETLTVEVTSVKTKLEVTEKTIKRHSSDAEYWQKKFKSLELEWKDDHSDLERQLTDAKATIAWLEEKYGLNAQSSESYEERTTTTTTETEQTTTKASGN